MSDPNTHRGDRVVDLAASLRFAALIAGATACAVSLWIIKQDIRWALGALVPGGIGGFCIGVILARLVFHARSGQVIVVKLGPLALGKTLKANLIGASASALIAA